MKRKIAIVIAVGCLIITQQAWSQKKMLTFQDAIKIAMKNSVVLNQQKNNLMYNEMQRTASYAGLGPTVSANAGASQVIGNTYNPNTLEVINGKFEQVTGSINANLNLFSGFYQVGHGFNR